MIHFSVNNLEKTIGRLTDLKRANIAYATMITLNEVGFELRQELNDSVNKELDITKKKVGDAFAYKKTNSKRNLRVLVFSKKDWHRDIIPHHFSGGTGGVIPLEHAQISRRNMGRGNSLIRSKNAKTLTKSVATKMLNNPRGDFFTISVDAKSHLPPGVYQRLGGRKGVKLISLFTKLAKYNKVLDVKEISTKYLQRELRQKFRKNLAKALKTSRR